MPNQPTLEDLINLTFEKCELISEKDEINSANDGKEIKPMPNQSDMKVIVTLTKEQFDLFKSMGQIIDNEYFNLPQYFKCIGEGKFEVLNFNQLPDYVKEDLKDIIPNPLQRELDVTDQLLEDFQKVIKAIPECNVHGNLCIPHALEWIEEKKAIDFVKEKREEMKRNDNGLMPEIRKH